VVGLVAQVGDHRQLLGLHLRGDLLQHLGPGDLVRQRGDDDVAVLDGYTARMRIEPLPVSYIFRISARGVTISASVG
jgi:hypothetical protein